MTSKTKCTTATVAAIIFHVVGLAGFLIKKELFVQLTVVNILLMFLLLIYTHPRPLKKLLIFILVCIVTGFTSEVIGVHTGLLFGNYRYTDILGPSLVGVPVIIGINWFVVVYCCGMMMKAVINKFPSQPLRSAPKIKVLSLVLDGAILAVLFDWIMEPVAESLGYWKWQSGIPALNYVSWFLISIILLLFFNYSNFNTTNKFGVNLLLIQTLFFLILRTFL